MVRVYMNYNPYRVETELSLKTDDGITMVSEESALMWIARMRMQRWLSEDCPRDFFDELRNNLGEEEIEILFSGTSEDMKDLTIAVERYMGMHKGINISVSHSNCNDFENSSQQKIQQLQELLLEAKMSPYYTVIPQPIWRQIEQLLILQKTQFIRIDLENWQLEQNKLSFGEPWDQVCLYFSFADIGSKLMHDALRTFSREISHGASREWDRERFMLICECPEAAMSDFQRTKDIVKKFLLEYGVSDLNVYLVPVEESALIYSLPAQGGSNHLHRIHNAMELYSRCYADKYQLHQKSDRLQRFLESESFVQGNELFRRIEKNMRSSKKFRDLRDQQVFDAYEWVEEFLDKLKHWLDNNAT